MAFTRKRHLTKVTIFFDDENAATEVQVDYADDILEDGSFFVRKKENTLNKSVAGGEVEFNPSTRVLTVDKDLDA